MPIVLPPMAPTDDNGTGLRTWINVDTNALAHNYEQFRSLIAGNTRLCAVVKSNAYGHSIVDYALTLDRIGVDWFAVDSLVEGERLREQGVEKPILVLGYTLPDMFAKAAEQRISVTISSVENLKKAASASLDDARGDLRVHLKIDTGMHRQGVFESEIDEVIEILQSADNVKLEGLYTHFPNAKNPSEPQYTKTQLEIFERVREKVESAGFSPIKHTAASSSTIIFPESHYDMVRVGIGLYGLWPAEATKQYAKDRIPLRPILSWKTLISEVKTVPAGSRFGYGLTESVSRETRMAVLPIGYWHGYDRSLSSIGHVLIRGQRAKVLGTISMDITVVDVTGIDGVEQDDEVTLIGSDPSTSTGQAADEVSADELAGMTGTINYEIVTRINPLIKRFYI